MMRIKLLLNFYKRKSFETRYSIILFIVLDGLKFGCMEWVHRNTIYFNKQNQEKQNADTHKILVFMMKHHISWK